MSRNNAGLSQRDLYWSTITDFVMLTILLLLSFCVVYLTNETISKYFFLVVLLLFVSSKKNYLWFAYFFIIAQGPGYLFSDLAAASQHRLPFYTFLAGMSFTPTDLFVVIALLKALFWGRKRKLQLDHSLLLLLAYFVFSLFVASLISGTDIDVIAWNLRWLFYYSIIVSFYYLLSTKKEIYGFLVLILPTVFFIIFTQIYAVVSGNEFVNLFDPYYRNMSHIVLTGAIRPYVGGGLIVYFCYIFSFFLLLNKDWQLQRMFLIFVIGTAFMSVFMSATRQWFVAFSLIIFGYVVISKRKILSAIGIVAVALILLSALHYFGLFRSGMQLNSAWMRLQQVFDVAQGQVHLVDTAENRFFTQLPIIMGVIKHNLLIGYGFSYVTMRYYDNDLGFVNTILMFGIIGFSLFIFFFTKLFLLLGSSIKKLSMDNAFKVPLKMILVAWFSLLVIYFSTQDFFAFYFHKVFFVSVLIALTEFFVAQAKSEEKLIRNR